MNKPKNLTIDDIAERLGVSKTTVSRAISGKGRISAATRERVMAYIQETHYRPSAAAKGLAESKTYNLALLVPRSLFKLDMPFIRRSMTAICEEAFLQDYNILLCLSTDDNPASLLRTLDNRKVDGVILSRTVENDAILDVLFQRDIPFATMQTFAGEKRNILFKTNTPANVFGLDQWVHIAFTWKVGDAIRLYVNGEKKGERKNSV